MVGRWVETIALRWLRSRLPGRGCVCVLDRWLASPADFRYAFGVDWGGGEGWAVGWDCERRM